MVNAQDFTDDYGIISTKEVDFVYIKVNEDSIVVGKVKDVCEHRDFITAFACSKDVVLVTPSGTKKDSLDTYKLMAIIQHYWYLREEQEQKP